MARTHMLSDLHYVLLATAASRANGSLLPPSSRVKAERASIIKAITALIRRTLAEEVETKNPKSVWREDGERRLAAVITAAGRAALHIADGKTPEDEVPAAPPATDVRAGPGAADPLAPPEPAAPGARAGTKQALLIEMLRREQGVTITELAEATAWLPHTTRAALTGLRKKGHAIAAEKQDGVSRYRLAAPVNG